MDKKRIKKTVCLIIMDGWGISERKKGNAIFQALTSNIDYYTRFYPNTRLSASGAMVGLPEGQMGNSEVGHLNIGAGRIVLQDYTKITDAIKNGDFYKNKAFIVIWTEDPVGFLIQNREAVKGFQAYFDAFWGISKK